MSFLTRIIVDVVAGRIDFFMPASGRVGYASSLSLFSLISQIFRKLTNKSMAGSARTLAKRVV